MHRKGREVEVGLRVRSLVLCGTIAVMAACAGRGASSDSSEAAVLTSSDAAAALEQCCGDSAIGVGLRIAADYKEPSITTRRYTYEQFWLAVQPMAEYARFDVATVGQSSQARPLRSITIGGGPTKVLVWSVLNDDESTGSMAMADLVRWFANTRAEDRDDALRERLLSGLTIVFVPLLNPAGVEPSDANRSSGVLADRAAPRLAAEDARVLQSVRDTLQPEFAFMLHDGTARARVADTGDPAAITLFVPPAHAAHNSTAGRERARLVAATLAKSFLTELPGRVVRYHDADSLSVSRDLMQPSGTSTVLVESGAVDADPQNQRLRSLHVAALLSAFDALATGAYEGASTALYERLPVSAGGVVRGRP